MKLVIVHYHLRPGGIRRVIELAVPHLLRRLPEIQSVVLATGEAGDAQWRNYFTSVVSPVPLEFFVEPGFNYLSEQKNSPAAITRKIQQGLERLLRGFTEAKPILWAHNLGIARNLLLTREVARISAERKVPLISHHHDLWFDNRWIRWPQMAEVGFPTLDAIARAIFPATPNVRHATINHSDAVILKRGLPKSVGWLPNPAQAGKFPQLARVRVARQWLDRELGERGAPVWILPCRLLRRKNVAEAFLLTRWLRPEAWLVTTGTVSSADELAYSKKLQAAVRRNKWRMRLGILNGDESQKPLMAELLAASECVLLPSIQEGFGLPYIEAAAAQRPLIARSLPNIAPDLKKFGFRFPQYYEDVLIDPSLFDWQAERIRQAKLFAAWKKQLPGSCRSLAGTPVLLAKNRPRPVPFSRLTLTAQLEVLSHPADQSWALCAPLNPFLKVWRERARRGRLQTSPWPRSADRWLGGAAYAHNFSRILSAGARPLRSPAQIQTDFIREKLGAGQQFPLLWSRES